MSKLSLPVLALNSKWMAIDVYSAEKALSMMYSGAAVGIDITADGMIPKKWEDWALADVGDNDDYMTTTSGRIKIPRVVIAQNYDRSRMVKIKLNTRNLAKMFNFRCGYTNQYVPLEEGSMDHYVPKSKNGRYEWKNAVYTSKSLNSKKGNKSAEQAGLRLARPLVTKAEVTQEQKVLLNHGMKFPEWGFFLREENQKSLFMNKQLNKLD